MRNLRDQRIFLPTLCQTILKFRLQSSAQLIQRLDLIHKSISKMNRLLHFEADVLALLIQQDQYGVKDKLNNFIDIYSKNLQSFCLQIHVSCRQKRTGKIWNTQLWKFQVLGDWLTDKTHLLSQSNHNEQLASLVQIIQFVISNIRVSSIMPIAAVSKRKKNKYIVDHKILIGHMESIEGLNQFENMASQQIGLHKNLKFFSKYYYNNSINIESIRALIEEKSLKALPQKIQLNKKKNSIDSTNTNCSSRASIWQCHDDDDDLYLLQYYINENSSIKVIFEKEEDEKSSQEEEYFQLLTEQSTLERNFLRENHSLLKQIAFDQYYLY